MEVKTESGGTFNAAGKGTTGLSIAGLVTGVTALIGNGLLENLVGNKNCSPCNAMMDNRYYNLLSEYEREKSERYTDQSIIAYNRDRYDARKEISDAIVEDRSRIARLEQTNESLKEISCLKEELFNQKLNALRSDLSCMLAMEGEKRKCGDQGIYNYANATFVPGKLIMPSDSICPVPMPLYNSWTAPTTTTTTTSTT